MKYKHNGEWKELKIKPFDSLPIDSIIEYDGDTIPEGYEAYIDYTTTAQKTLFETTSWDSMMTRFQTKSIDFTPYDYVEVEFTGQGGTNATNTILKIDLHQPVKTPITNDGISYNYGASICYPDIQLLQGANNDPGIFRIGACISTAKDRIWMGDPGYFTGQTSSGNFDTDSIYNRISKIVGFKFIQKLKKKSQGALPDNKIVNTHSDSQTDTYSCDYINKKLPKITVWSSSTPMITADNEEIRCIGSDGTVSSLSLSFLDTLTFTDSTKFSSSIVFKTSSSGCSFTVTPPTSVSLRMAGDDVTDENFAPQPNKVYDIVFYWNGFYLNGIVKGTVKTYEITVENGGSDSSYKSFYIYTKEDASDQTAIEWSNSKKLTLTQNYLYIGITAAFRRKWEETLNCEWESISSSDILERYKVTITDSPAYVKLLCWEDLPPIPSI